MFCGCFAVFCECFAAFPQNTQNTRIKKTKNTGKHENSQYARVLRAFSKSQKFPLYCTKHFSQNICKTLQNTAKQSQNAFCEITSQNTAKQRQNAQDCHKTVAIQPQYVLRAFGVFLKNTLNLLRKHTIRIDNTQYTRKLRGARTRRGSRSRIVDVFQKQCFAVFCGDLWCFAVFCVRVFSVFHKTDQKIYKTHKTNKIRFVQYSAIRCCASFSHSENVYKKIAEHVQNIAKHPQNTAKHCFSKNTRKKPQNTRKIPAKHRETPRNTTKHIC